LVFPAPVDWKRETAFCDAEIEDARHPVHPDHDVLGRYIAVDDVEGDPDFVRSFVRGMQPVQGATHDACVDCGEDCGLHGTRTPEQAREVVAMDVLHDQEDLSGLLQHDHIERHRGVGVLDPSCEARLIEKHGDELGVVRVVGMEVLDGYVRENPAAPNSRPIWTVAIPPDAISSYMT